MDNRAQWSMAAVLLAGLTCACSLFGCIALQSQFGLTAKESRMSDELIRGQVLRYKAEVEEDLSDISKMFSTVATADSPFTPEMSSSIATAFAQMKEDMTGTIDGLDENLRRYYRFYEELKHRGGDMRGLQLDFPPEFEPPRKEKHYSPPIQPPPIPGIDIKELEAVSGDRTRFLA